MLEEESTKQKVLMVINKSSDKSDRNRFINKGESVSNSMSRMIRSSPKIHLKQHISSQGNISSVPKKNSNISKNVHNKLHLNRVSAERASMNQDSSRNNKLEAINNRALNPIKTSSGSFNKSAYNQSSVIGNSLTYSNDGMRMIHYITPKLNHNDFNNKHIESTDTDSKRLYQIAANHKRY